MATGLPICRSAIGAHSGYIRVDKESTLGGARFSSDLQQISATSGKFVQEIRRQAQQNVVESRIETLQCKLAAVVDFRLTQGGDRNERSRCQRNENCCAPHAN